MMLGVDVGRSAFRDVTPDFLATVENRKKAPRPLPVQTAGTWSFLTSLTNTTLATSQSTLSTSPTSESDKGKEMEWTHRQLGLPLTTKAPAPAPAAPVRKRSSTTQFLELALQTQERLTVALNNLNNLNQQLQKGFSAFDDGKEEAVIASVGRVVDQSKADIQKLSDMLSNSSIMKNSNTHSTAHYDCILKQLKTKHHSLDQALSKARDKRLKNVEERMRTASAFFGQAKPGTTSSLLMPPSSSSTKPFIPMTIHKPHTQPLVHSAAGQLELIDEPITTFRAPRPIETSAKTATSNDADQMLVLDVQEGDNKMMAMQTKGKDVSESYYESRAKQAMGLLKSFESLASIFREVQTHVDIQGRQVDMIGYNVEQSALSIERAEEELFKTVRNQKSNRALYAKLFGVLLVFIFVFFVFFV